MAIVSKLTYERIPSFYEENTSPSLTVPDDCLTIRDLFERYRRGDVLHVRHDGEYEDELVDDDLDRDLVLDGIPVDRMEVELNSEDYERRIRKVVREGGSDSRSTSDDGRRVEDESGASSEFSDKAKET